MLGHKLVRAVLTLGSIAMWCCLGALAALAEGPARAVEGPTLLRLPVGGTVPVVGEPGSFERVLVMPPDGEGATVGNTWEISADVALRLSRLPQEERWRAIRRNLGLAPEDRDDLVLWTGVADAAFDSLARLPLLAGGGAHAFGLRVAFPGKEAPDPPAEVAITFANSAMESGFQAAVAEAVTGVEGFVTYATDSGAPPAVDLLDGIEIDLLDSQKRPVGTTKVCQGYFCFSRLPVDPDFGSDYYLVVAPAEETLGPVTAAPVYVPVMRGIRTRVHLTVPRPIPLSPAGGEKGLQSQDWAINGGPAALLLQQFVAGSSFLNTITQRLPANPGLHLGVIQTPEGGPATLWSTRFLLRPPTLDRRPRFVSMGKLRLQSLTVPSTAYTAARHYVKLTWVAQATPYDLKLSSRPVSRTPWGIGIGVAPSADPTLYAVGLSYKLVPTAEVLAGVGLQEGRSGSFVYGLTFDVDPILDGVFGRRKAQE